MLHEISTDLRLRCRAEIVLGKGGDGRGKYCRAANESEGAKDDGMEQHIACMIASWHGP